MKPWNRSSEERIQDALLKKEEGNRLFQGKHYYDAGVQYINALRDTIPILEEDQEIIAFKTNLYSNLAACQLNLNQHNRAILNCTKVLNIDQCHKKCLYRRASAYLKILDYENANMDIKKLLTLDSSNKAAKQLHDQLKKALARKDCSDAETMRKFMGLMND